MPSTGRNVSVFVVSSNDETRPVTPHSLIARFLGDHPVRIRQHTQSRAVYGLHVGQVDHNSGKARFNGIVNLRVGDLREVPEMRPPESLITAIPLGSLSMVALTGIRRLYSRMITPIFLSTSKLD